jgi:hypothetical protein
VPYGASSEAFGVDGALDRLLLVPESAGFGANRHRVSRLIGAVSLGVFPPEFRRSSIAGRLKSAYHKTLISWKI